MPANVKITVRKEQGEMQAELLRDKIIWWWAMTKCWALGSQSNRFP